MVDPEQLEKVWKARVAIGGEASREVIEAIGRKVKDTSRGTTRTGEYDRLLEEAPSARTLEQVSAALAVKVRHDHEARRGGQE